MTSPARAQFESSKNIGYEQWHDGVGYDMDAFAAMSPADRAAEAEIAMAKSDPDWRDLDVVAAHGTPECYAHLRDLLLHESIETRAHALGRLIDAGQTPGSVADVQLAHIIDALPDDSDHYPDLTQAMYLAQQHAGPISKLSMLRGAQTRGTLALHLASHLLDLSIDCPDTAAFDPRFRPILLRLLPGNDQGDREAAFAEVCKALKIDPATIPDESSPDRWKWAEKTWPRT